MKSKDFTDRLYSIETTKKFGTPNGLGFITCGVSYCGEDNQMAGIYQKRIASKYSYDNLNAQLGLILLGQNELGKSQFKKNDNQFNKKIVVRMRHYVTPNPQTETQQTWRNYFTTVLQSWQALSENDKNIWRSKSYPAHMSGWNRYARYHLKHRDI
jgi:hypothetical protein